MTEPTETLHLKQAAELHPSRGKEVPDQALPFSSEMAASEPAVDFL